MLTLGGCTKNFTAINTDPTQASASVYDPNLLLPSAELGYMGANQGYSAPILFQSMWAQIFASAEFPSYYSNGDKYVASSNILRMTPASGTMPIPQPVRPIPSSR